MINNIGLAEFRLSAIKPGTKSVTISWRDVGYVLPRKLRVYSNRALIESEIEFLYAIERVFKKTHIPVIDTNEVFFNYDQKIEIGKFMLLLEGPILNYREALWELFIKAQEAYEACLIMSYERVALRGEDSEYSCEKAEERQC